MDDGKRINLVIDEVQTAYFWGLQVDNQTGTPFRETFGRIKNLINQYRVRKLNRICLIHFTIRDSSSINTFECFLGSLNISMIYSSPVLFF